MIFGQPFETAFDQKPVTVKTYTLDAIMALVPTVPYGADALLEANTVHTYQDDGIIELGVVESYAADALAEAQVHETYRMAGRIKIDIYEYFYVADAALMKTNVRAGYRMGGMISNTRYSPPEKKQPAYTAKQSLIQPEDIRADDRFRFARR